MADKETNPRSEPRKPQKKPANRPVGIDKTQDLTDEELTKISGGQKKDWTPQI
jgi:hypothetical protein